MGSKFTESTVEEAVLEWAEGLAYAVQYGPEIAPDEPAAERESFGEVLLMGRLRDAIARINPKVPAEAQDEALRRVIRTETANLIENNRRFHRMLVDGIDVEYQADGRTVHDKVWLVDFVNLDNNDWLAVNQYTVIEDKHNRRPDVVLFVNGLPLVVIELKNAADENATTKKAFDQLQTYKLQLPTLMTYNVCLVASDGITARIGTLTGGLLGSHYTDIFAFIVLIIVLTLRPSGLLGERGLGREDGEAGGGDQARDAHLAVPSRPSPSRRDAAGRRFTQGSA